MSTIFQGLNRAIDRPLFSRMVVGVSLATMIALGIWMAFEIDADVNRRAAQVNKFCESLEGSRMQVLLIPEVRFLSIAQSHDHWF